jgi:hypothetical protein
MSKRVLKDVNGRQFASFTGQCAAGEKFLRSGAPGSQVEIWLCELLAENERIYRRYSGEPTLSVSTELHQWWEQKRSAYLEWEAVENERKAAEAERLRASGLAKLTDDEKRALNLK